MSDRMKHDPQMEKRFRLIQKVGKSSMIAIAIVVIATFFSGMIDSMLSSNANSVFLSAACIFAGVLWLVLVGRDVSKFLKS